MLANSLDASGSSGRPVAEDQKRPTARASRQSNTMQAILTVIEPPGDDEITDQAFGAIMLKFGDVVIGVPCRGHLGGDKDEQA
jgi:hypothetical protein